MDQKQDCVLPFYRISVSTLQHETKISGELLSTTTVFFLKVPWDISEH